MSHLRRALFPSDRIVRDLSHLSGAFGRISHSNCIVKYHESFFIPVVFHNLSGYDSHFIIRYLAKFSRIFLLSIIEERYISITKYGENTNIKICSIDSFVYLGAFLSHLALYLKPKIFVNFRKEIGNVGLLDLLTRKYVFPYD